MMSTGLEKVDTIDDIAKAFQLIQSFGLSTEGLNSLYEMKNKLREHLNGLEGTSSRKIGETHEVISDAGKRRMLLDLYERTKQFMDQFEEDFLEILQKSFEDLNKSLQERKKNVEPIDQYVVLVAGETSAGKSSVINLILGEDLLPSTTLSTTSTICELKYGEKPMVGVHYKPNGTKTPEPAFHELNDGSKTYKEQIEKFVYVKEDREKTPYEKIELFFPHPLFKENVMIVDSPGVGESDVMSSFVLNYMPRAFCFIYVLCASNAGGIQPDRLTQGEQVKLADVGVAKHEKETGTTVGTFLYLAPEVCEGRIYNRKVDMYSFGFVLWEIWYGETAFQTAMTTCGLHQLEKVRQGCRPTHIEGTIHPYEIWQHVMTTCWNENPRARLTASKALERFKELHEAEIQPKLKPVPLPRTPSPRLLSPPTAPTQARRPNKQGGASVSYHKKPEAESVHFELKEKK